MTVFAPFAILPHAIGRRFAAAAFSRKRGSSDISAGEGTAWSDRLEREMSDRMTWSRPIWLAPISDNRPDWHQAD